MWPLLVSDEKGIWLIWLFIHLFSPVCYIFFNQTQKLAKCFGHLAVHYFGGGELLKRGTVMECGNARLFLPSVIIMNVFLQSYLHL